MLKMRRQPPARGIFGERRSVATLEFALVAPVLATMTVGVFDLTRAFIIWEQLNGAAEAIVEAAEKLSAASATAQNPVTTLTPSQMQAAMSTIYADIPGLQWGTGTGIFPGAFAVTLSSVVYLQSPPLKPWCTTNTQCGPLTPYTLWSAYLVEGGPGAQLNTNNSASRLWRVCGALLPATQFPNNGTQLTYMLVPPNVGGWPLVPQVVADVRYDFTPNFPFFLGAKTFTFWASATLPAPLGGVTQEITAAVTGDAPSYLEQCHVPPPPGRS